MNDDDLEMQRLEALLSVYRCSVPAPDFRRRPLRHYARWLLASAAAIAVIAIVVLDFIGPRPDDWRAVRVSGTVDVPRVLRPGQLLQTGAGGRVQLRSEAIGIVDVGERTTIRLVENREGRHRLALAAGTIHARTTSPPGVFVVDTPRARAIDLGCEYTLTVAAGGEGLLRVASGWVELARGFEESVVPQGAIAAIGARGELTAPYFEDAAPALRAAVQRLSFGGSDRARDLQQVLALARVRDALTLLNLFSRTGAEERLLVYDRLNQLVPAPAAVTRQSVRTWSPGVTEAWWAPVLKASGVGPIKKKRASLPSSELENKIVPVS